MADRSMKEEKKQKHVKRKPLVVLYLCLENFQILI